jgi:hypothetical protein
VHPGPFAFLGHAQIQVFRQPSDTSNRAWTPLLTHYPWPWTAEEAKMSLRVDKPQAQGRWREGQLSWDMGHQKKRQQKNQSSDSETSGKDAEGGSLYNSKGDLIPLSSSLKTGT